MLELKDMVDLVTGVWELRAKFGRRFWWRGESKDFETWLVPGMLREERDKREEPSILMTFRQRARSRRSDVPADSDRAGWLFLMQHNGLPTRLLDWSENPLAALFFAVESDSDEPGVLWCLIPTGLNKSMTGEEGLFLHHHDDVAYILAIAFSGEGASDKVLALLPVENELKIMLQAGRFTIHGAADSLADRSDSDKYLFKWTIPAESKGVLRKQLDFLGIRRSSLFPDLTDLAADIAARLYKEP